MDKKHINIHVPCSRHTSEHIQRVSTDVNASQHLFCLECVLHQTQKLVLPSSKLKTIPDFIDMAAQFYSQHKDTTTSSSASDIPDEFISLLSKQADVLETLSIHITEEKKKVEVEFDALIHDVLQLLTDKKNSYMQVLDQQLLNLRYWYISFARKIKKAYPTPEDIVTLYPSRDDLVNKAQKITNDTQLTAFVRGINEDIYEVNKPDQNERLTLQEARKKELSELSKQLSELDHTRPAYKMEDYSRSELVKKLNENLTETMERLFELKNPISDVTQGLNAPDSNLITLEEYSYVRSWLDAKYRSQKPKLLYRGERDGMNATSFHQKCDDKGPTITFLKVKSSKNPSEVHVIGGFAGESWKSVCDWIQASEGFIFSITKKIKCSLIPGCENRALCGNDTYGPIFGESDLHVTPGFSKVTLTQKSYSESSSIRSHSGANNSSDFQLVEIEVFSI